MSLELSARKVAAMLHQVVLPLPAVVELTAMVQLLRESVKHTLLVVAVQVVKHR